MSETIGSGASGVGGPRSPGVAMVSSPRLAASIKAFFPVAGQP